MKMFRQLCIAGLAATMATVSGMSLAEPPRAPVIKVETTKKVILDENFMWMTKAQADKLVNDISAAGFNVLIPVVWHGRGTSWPSKMAPKEDLWEFSKPFQQDPLRYLIDTAHAKGIEVHPWFTVTMRQREFLPQFYDSGTPKTAFDVRSPAFRDFIVNLMLEVVKNYDVDGLNLDYIRSMGVCTSKACLAEYKTKYGKDPRDDEKLIFKNDAALERLASWNEPYITDIVQRISTQAKQIKPNLVISVDTHPMWKEFKAQGANSIDWANRGLVDVVYDMQYTQTIDTKQFNAALAKMTDPSKLVLMVGNFEGGEFTSKKASARDAGIVARLLAEGQKLNPHNNGAVALYEYPYLSSGQVQSIKAGPFAKPDTLPAGSVTRHQ